MSGTLLAQDKPLPPPRPAPVTSTTAPEMDLPMPPVRYAPVTSRTVPDPPIQPDEEYGEDPTDTPPPVFFGEELWVEGSKLVYVIDRSGSMIRDDRIVRARAELIKSINGLHESFEFNVWAYHCGNKPCFPGLVPASPANKKSAAAWINKLEVWGGTNTGPCVGEAIMQHPSCMHFVLLTDGSPGACGSANHEYHRKLIRQANRQKATVDVFGIAALGRFRAFCQGVAFDNGPGRYVDVP
jgi:hypothetical protein